MSVQPHIALLGQANSVHLQRWAVALFERGRRVTVLTQQVASALPLPDGVGFQALPFDGEKGYFRNARFLRRWLRVNEPDLLHVHYASGYGSTAMLANWHPTLLSVWGSDVYDFPYESWFKGWLLRRNLRFADALASTSAAMAQQVRRLWPGAGEIAVTPFGVDLSQFRPVAKRSGAFTIGTVKTLSANYGIDILLKAFASIAPMGDMRLLIVGDGPQREELKALAQALGIADRVDWPGAVCHSEVPDWLNQLDVYVAASRRESFGVAVVEAMACGLPVVVSDAGGLPEVVDDNRSGLVIPRENPQALAEALKHLLENPELRARLAAAGRKKVLTEYDWPRCVDRMLLAQDAVMAAHRP